MRPSEYFLQDCMYWLTEFSVYKNRINRMQDHLNAIKPEVTDSKTAEYALMKQCIAICSRRLAKTERKIIHTIKQQIHNCYIPVSEKLYEIENEDELFDEMKNAYSLFIELQRSINFYLEEYKLPKPASIEIPYSLKLQQEKFFILS